MKIQKLPIIVRLDGLTAREHRLPGYDAGESIAGFSRAIELSTYFLATEKVRYKKPELQSFKLEFIAVKHGSFEFVYELIVNIDEFKGIAAGITGSGVYDFLKFMMIKVTGRESKSLTDIVKKINYEKGPDIEALADAIEPSARRFHTPINKGASKIIIINGDNNVINFGPQTKEYLNSNKTDGVTRAKVFSIGSFNVNSGYGRAFDREEKRTIPFQTIKGASQKTKVVLAASLQRYAEQDLETAWIELKYDQIVSPNGKVKKLLVHRARVIDE